MEKKRKLPPRAAARAEQAAKRRTMTPPHRSETPAPSPAPDPVPTPVEDAPPPLPTSVVPGKPLPTVDSPQPDDLSTAEFQSVTESGVLAESLSRSRQKWTMDGIFEKYWAKPIKKKGVLIEDPNNPPKDSMVKLGQVTITVEPHVFEATMFAVKDPKPPPPPSSERPILQYGPPNGVLPPPAATAPAPAPGAAASTPTSEPAKALPPAAAAAAAPAADPKPSATLSSQTTPQPPTPAPTGTQPATDGSRPPAPPLPPLASRPVPSPRGMEAVLSPTPSAPTDPQPSAGASSQPPGQRPPPGNLHGPRLGTFDKPGYNAPLEPPHDPNDPVALEVASRARADPALKMLLWRVANRVALPHEVDQLQRLVDSIQDELNLSGVITPQDGRTMQNVAHEIHASLRPPAPPAANSPLPSLHPPPPVPAPPAPAPAAKPAVGDHPPASDPIILMLAEKASADPMLREMMRRVAQGAAPKHELERFQAIVEAVTVESKRTGVTAPPSAEKLVVDGRTVQYFANEVHAILDIVLRSNPKQTGKALRPPVGSDPLVVELVREALDEPRTREMVDRIATRKPYFSDPTDLKRVLDGLHGKILKDKPPQQALPSSQGALPAPAKPAAAPNGHAAPSPNTAPPGAPQTALRSKGPPPPPSKPDISAVVFEFAGGSGDRYLFPKFSILEYVPVPQGQQAIASFLLVRKGSQAEYPMADPALDYYQPLTIRLFASSGRHLENLARVVAPQDEVRRYMNDVMTKMTRAEYILLAMRLPRPGPKAEEEDGEGEKVGREKERGKGKENVFSDAPSQAQQQQQQKPTPTPTPTTLKQAHLDVLWTKKPAKAAAGRAATPTGQRRDLADEQYQSFIASVSRKD
ncbi:hypothetical protein VTJ83DRAFT_3269 [Remersonia thermophila]|uniref:SWR1-complex protein 3 domain-containing protein n=1 Tax=Remersonia thermophila TaxID=72144 RepID=A0ABR4DDI8_9PEZI